MRVRNARVRGVRSPHGMCSFDPSWVTAARGSRAGTGARSRRGENRVTEPALRRNPSESRFEGSVRSVGPVNVVYGTVAVRRVVARRGDIGDRIPDIEGGAADVVRVEGRVDHLE